MPIQLQIIIMTLISHTIFIALATAVAIGIPYLLRHWKLTRFIKDEALNIFTGAILAYAAVIGFVMPLATWLSNLH